MEGAGQGKVPVECLVLMWCLSMHATDHCQGAVIQLTWYASGCSCLHWLIDKPPKPRSMQSAGCLHILDHRILMLTSSTSHQSLMYEPIMAIVAGGSSVAAVVTCPY